MIDPTAAAASKAGEEAVSGGAAWWPGGSGSRHAAGGGRSGVRVTWRAPQLASRPHLMKKRAPCVQDRQNCNLFNSIAHTFISRVCTISFGIHTDDIKAIIRNMAGGAVSVHLAGVGLHHDSRPQLAARVTTLQRSTVHTHEDTTPLSAPDTAFLGNKTRT